MRVENPMNGCEKHANAETETKISFTFIQFPQTMISNICGGPDDNRSADNNHELFKTTRLTDSSTSLMRLQM